MFRNMLQDRMVYVCVCVLCVLCVCVGVRVYECGWGRLCRQCVDQMRSTLLNVHLDSWRQLGQVRFALRMKPGHRNRAFGDAPCQVVAFLSVVSPTSFIRPPEAK